MSRYYGTIGRLRLFGVSLCAREFMLTMCKSGGQKVMHLGDICGYSDTHGFRLCFSLNSERL